MTALSTHRRRARHDQRFPAYTCAECRLGNCDECIDSLLSARNKVCDHKHTPAGDGSSATFRRYDPMETKDADIVSMRARAKPRRIEE